MNKSYKETRYPVYQVLWCTAVDAVLPFVKALSSWPAKQQVLGGNRGSKVHKPPNWPSGWTIHAKHNVHAWMAEQAHPLAGIRRPLFQTPLAVLPHCVSQARSMPTHCMPHTSHAHARCAAFPGGVPKPCTHQAASVGRALLGSLLPLQQPMRLVHVNEEGIRRVETGTQSQTKSSKRKLQPRVRSRLQGLARARHAREAHMLAQVLETGAAQGCHLGSCVSGS